MKLKSLLIATTLLAGFGAMAGTSGTADRRPYIITFHQGLDTEELNLCVEKICKLSGTRQTMECEIISERFRKIAATLSNSAVKKVRALDCVERVRLEESYGPRPRSELSN